MCRPLRQPGPLSGKASEAVLMVLSVGWSHPRPLLGVSSPRQRQSYGLRMPGLAAVRKGDLGGASNAGVMS